jgi:hypothetical protein
MNIFISAAAQFDNLGDLILRREAIHKLQDYGRVHVYLGPACAGYVAGLRLPDQHVAYRSYSSWVRACLVSGAASALIFAPGEQLLAADSKSLTRAVANLGVAGLVRARGGKVLKIGRGYASVTTAGLVVERALLATCHFASARDLPSSRLTGMQLAPDVALSGDWTDGDHASTARRAGAAFAYRNDRPADLALALEALPLFRDAVPPLRALAQVRRDDASVLALSRDGCAQPITWGAGSHPEQLDRVVDAYRRSQFVVSNRLHALYFALVAGAIPVALTRDTQGKVAVGLAGLDLQGSVLSSLEEVRSFLTRDSALLAAEAAAARAKAEDSSRSMWRNVSDVLRGEE